MMGWARIREKWDRGDSCTEGIWKLWKRDDGWGQDGTYVSNEGQKLLGTPRC